MADADQTASKSAQEIPEMYVAVSFLVADTKDIDFCVVWFSQDLSAPPEVRQHSAKYAMLIRMWTHGIQPFLNLLKQSLPKTIDYMLEFIDMAYEMMALLYKTVIEFEDIWIECLGDLGRYRMAIVSDDSLDRKIWADIARSWYTKAADKDPALGRIYHHLAILARPNALEQLYYFSRTLTCSKPFPSARGTILTLLDPIHNRAAATYSHTLPVDTSFIGAHEILFKNLPIGDFKLAKQNFLRILDNHIGRVKVEWKNQGVHVAVTNIASWFQYGVDDTNISRQVCLKQLLESAKNMPPGITEATIRTASTVDRQDPISPSVSSPESIEEIKKLTEDPFFKNAQSITNETTSIVLRRIGDENVLPHVHVMLSFLSTFASSKYVSQLLNNAPWADLVAFLNALIKTENQSQSQTQNRTHHIHTLLSADVFPGASERTDELPLPEDYMFRGLVWAQDYFPRGWFEREHDKREQYPELASTVKCRNKRVLRLGYQLAEHQRWIRYDTSSHTFTFLPTVTVHA